MAADTLEGKREAIVTEYMLRILGLDVSMHDSNCIALQLWCFGYPCVVSHCNVALEPHIRSCAFLPTLGMC